MNQMTRLALRALAVLCIVVGLATFPTPLPTGIPLVSLGLVLLLSNSRVAPIWMRALRRRSALVDRLVVQVEAAAPTRWREILRRTGRRPRRALAGLALRGKKPVGQL